MRKNFKFIQKNQLYKSIIIFFILLIFMKQIDFFKKVYFTFTRTYETRLVNSYEYCGQESIGFLNYIKNNFNILTNIKIVNFASSPNSSWYFDNFKKLNPKKVIFLNYNKNNKNFDYSKSEDISYDLNDYKIIYQFNNCYFLEKK